MDLSALGLTAVAFAIVLGTWVVYLSTVPRGTVPRRPVGAIATVGIGLIVAVWGLASGFQSSVLSGIIAIVPAVPALMLGLVFYFLLTQRKTPIGNLQVNVGDKFLPFTAVTSDGQPFSTDEWAGKRVLLKFYRGGW